MNNNLRDKEENPEVFAIIVAGGSGVRMNSSVRKQYLEISEVPVISHTIKAFENSKKISEIILVIPKSDFEFFKSDILAPLKPKLKITLVAGGGERQESVYNGLKAVKENSKNSIVLIHDGVRPFVSEKQIDDCINGALKYKAAIPALSAFDTLKKADSEGFIRETIDRENVYYAQTPQAFEYSIIREAHDFAARNKITGTDDASLLEKTGVKVKIIPGSKSNIKITDKDDLILAELISKL